MSVILALWLVVSGHARTLNHSDLPRRVWLGVTLNPTESGLVVGGTLVGGSAERSTLREGDQLVRLQEAPVPTMPALGAALRTHRVRERVTLTVMRNNAEVKVPLRLKGRPLEKANDLDIIYGSVEVESGTLATITLRPTGVRQPLPGIYFVQGLSCATIEHLQGPLQPVGELLYGLARAGYAVMRIQKAGMGDSTGKACTEVGFDEEVAGFLAGLRAFKADQRVDEERVVVLGHSMGGIQAPILAGKDAVAGIAVYGTGVTPWAEYLVDNERRQGRLGPETNLAELESHLRHVDRFQHQLLVEGRNLEAIVADHPELQEVAAATYPDGIHSYGRHVRFFQELGQRIPAQDWAKIKVPVLAMYGEFDIATSEAEHAYIVDIVNQAHPGHAKLQVFEGLFHGFNQRDSMSQVLEDPWSGPLGEDVLPTLLGWLDELPG